MRLRMLYIALLGMLTFAAIAEEEEIISSHNELQAAIGAAYDIFFSAGCERPDHKRTKRYALIKSDGEYRIEGNHITISCLKASAQDPVATYAPDPVEIPTPTSIPVPVLVTATFSWDHPTTRADGSPISPSEISKYEFFHKGGIIELEGTETRIVMSGLTKGDYWFYLIVLDETGQRSEPSDPITLTVD